MASKIYDPALIREVSLKVYRASFSDDDRERILRDPERGEPFFVRHSAQYDSLTRRYLAAIGIEPTFESKQGRKG